MSAASSTIRVTESPSAASWRSAAVVRGIGLIGVVKGFARSVLELGGVMSGAVARLKAEGGDQYSANAGFDFMGVLSLLQRAVMMADALRTRLRTPAVAVALARFWTVPAGARKESPRATPRPEIEPDVEDPLWRIAYVRGDNGQRREWLEAIEGMSDREVLTRIHANLLEASAMLGETDMAAEVRVLGGKALALLDDAADEADGQGKAEAPDDGAARSVAPATVVTQPVAHGMLDEASDPCGVPDTRTSLREAGRRPP
jgi:hypothetical protein